MKDPNAPRVAIAEHPDVKRMLLFGKAVSEATRSLLLKTAYYSDLAEVTEDETERDKYKGYVELFTPMCKGYSTDLGFDVCVAAIQVFGGYGYCQEYPVEQYARDCKIMSIYEGTNGIQALDLLGRKIAMKGGMLYMNFLTDLGAFIEENKSHEKLGACVEELNKYKASLEEISGIFMNKSLSGDMLFPISHATPYLRMFSEVVCSWLLLEQAVIAQQRLDEIFQDKGAADEEAQQKLVSENEEAKFYAGKVTSAKFYVTQILPDVEAKALSVKTEDRTVLDAVL